MRDYVAPPEGQDLTLELWIEIIQHAAQAHELRK